MPNRSCGPIPCRLAATTLLALAAALPAPAAAQAAPAVACPNGVISDVFIDNHSVFDLADPSLDDRFSWAYRLANRLHVPTRAEVIQRELLFAAGDCYDLEVLRESERVLRAAAFIADVDVFGIRQPDGSYHVVVDTRDEWSFRLEPQFDRREGRELVGVQVREDNLLGYGRQLTLHSLRHYDAHVYGGSFFTPQLFGTRWDAGFAYARTPVGHAVLQSVTHPFVGEVGRWAFRQQLRYEERYFEYHTHRDDELLTVLFPERRAAFDVGGMFRVGGRGRTTLFGLGLAGERVDYPARPVRVYAGGRSQPVEAGMPEAIAAALGEVENVRTLFLVGQRNVRFVRRRALDTVRGTEDARIGVEIEGVMGHTLPPFSRDRGLSFDLGIFVSGEPAGGLYTGGQASFEMRRDDDAPVDRSEWSDVIGQADLWAYWRPHEESRHTVVGSATVAGGWHTQVPFQLTLGGGSGLRGYRRHTDRGAHRVVASLEARSYLGWPLPRLFDVGTVAFVDVGRSWGGGVPFAVDSELRASAGVGLRTAFPPGSRQTFRVDVAAPIAPGVQLRDVVVQVGMGQAIGARAVRYDPQLRRSSRRGLMTSVFTFPE